MVEKKIERRVISKEFIYAIYPNKPNLIHHLNNSPSYFHVYFEGSPPAEGP
jgi:hypothetical protein